MAVLVSTRVLAGGGIAVQIIRVGLTCAMAVMIVSWSESNISCYCHRTASEPSLNPGRNARKKKERLRLSYSPILKIKSNGSKFVFAIDIVLNLFSLWLFSLSLSTTTDLAPFLPPQKWCRQDVLNFSFWPFGWSKQGDDFFSSPNDPLFQLPKKSRFLPPQKLKFLTKVALL